MQSIALRSLVVYSTQRSRLYTFIGRRGLPQKVCSDNSTNFLGAANVLKYAAERGLEWVFIPPRATHFGGQCEAAVKAAKHRLVRGVGNARLTYDEQRPQRRKIRTPGHLLIGQPLLSLPHESVLDEANSKASFAYLKRSRMLLALKQQFWRSWSSGYLTTLQQRKQWAKDVPNLEVRCLVLVHEDYTPPQKWITGRVMATTVGEDGKVRVVEIRTPTAIIKRLIYKVAVLPIAIVHACT
ncbi:uncharacterized protein LOC115763936 [Drosophila novamexicana]|uniref:uncharacterized protein LOC115763936 n=1 Tax=Drosophila novamexicana TaxID=47314 RepID=UPI0011E5F988|nr:uncharacterized protein LOC115763936 [Drosophila novamexicana]